MNFNKEFKISQEILKQYEMTKKQVKELKTGTQYIVYNPLTKQYKEEVASPIDIVHNRYCYSELKFYKEILKYELCNWENWENK